MVNYEVKQIIAEISSSGGYTKRLTLTSWNGSPAKLDLRIWHDSLGTETPGRGITLTDTEARTLAEAIQGFLQAQ